MEQKIKGFDEELKIECPQEEGKWSEWLNAEHLPEEAIAWLQQFAYYLAKNDSDDTKNPKQKKLTVTQLRKFFGGLKKIESETVAQNFNASILKYKQTPVDRNKLINLIPQLTYAVARDKKKENGDVIFETKLIHFAKWCIINLQIIDNLSQLKNFIKALEAIVAYHKFYEDKDNQS